LSVFLVLLRTRLDLAVYLNIVEFSAVAIFTCKLMAGRPVRFQYSNASVVPTAKELGDWFANTTMFTEHYGRRRMCATTWRACVSAAKEWSGTLKLGAAKTAGHSQEDDEAMFLVVSRHQPRAGCIGCAAS